MERVNDASCGPSGCYTYQVSRHSTEMLHNLNQQRKNGGRFCDVLLRVGDESFPAHRAVLAACSAYFHLLYRERPAGGRRAVRLSGGAVTAPAFSRLLDFMYEGRLELRGLPAEDVLAAASYLHMDDVASVCKGRLRGRGRAPPRGTPAPGAEPARPPPRAPPAGGLSGPGLPAAVPPGARGPPPWPVPAESDRALDLSLKPGRRREPGHPPAVPPTPPCGPRQRGAGPPARGPQDSPSRMDSVGPPSCPSPPQAPRVPAARRPAGALDPPPLGPGRRGPELDLQREATEGTLPPGGRLCACPLCGQPCPGAHALQRHLSAHFRARDGARARLSPDGAAPTCPLCGKTFSCAYTLKRHERTHSGEKPYACAQCGKSFQYSHNLSRHAVVHTREKPHACRWCARRFTQSGDLYRHVRKFHCGPV